VYEAEDWLDDAVRIAVRVTIEDERAVFDFTGSAAQVAGPLNAVEAITVSAVYYVIRCLLGTSVPASAGLLDPVTVLAPAGTVVNASLPAAVAGGNVETSQRIVDVLFKALAPAEPEVVPAASQGTMNNHTIGGIDSRTGKAFSYYETIGGGMGARPFADGLDAVHTHMTNSLNTPVEALELAYPLRVTRYSIRRGSGGEGRFRGGNGIVREVELLSDAAVSILSDRRIIAPFGLAGGEPGATGTNYLVRDGIESELPSTCSFEGRRGDRIRIETPGGGGYGPNTVC
jgi:N-methylhydantoinase B